MSKERVSVLVTFYNQEKYVDKALSSIFCQKTSFDFKVVVGDDGSNDGTQTIVQKWIDKYPDKIKMIIADREDGVTITGFRASRNRLKLLEEVDTEYFIFLDGDDYFDCADKLEKQVEILDKEANNDCIACGHNIDMLFPDGTRKPMLGPEVVEGKYTPEEYLKKLYFHTDTLLVRSTVIPKIDKKLLENNFNDNTITYVLLQEGNLYYLPNSWAVYVQTGDGIWTEGRRTISLIRNMFLYDLSNIINPSLKEVNNRRFADLWLQIFKIRKQIKVEELGPFLAEAKDKKLKYSYYWINYQKDNIFIKLKLILIVLYLRRKYILNADK